MKNRKPAFCLAKSIATLLFTTACLTTQLHALPRGEQVGHGSASFSRDGNEMVIRAGNGSIINYQSFNIDRGEKVQFIQPGSSSRVLNRVLDGDPTHIFGSLQANGRVYIVNPAGIFFESGAVINVGGLIAGAGSLADADFIAGRDHFTNLTGEVANRGIITSAGDIGLFGSTVANFGALTSKTGMVAMVAGDDVLVGERGSNIFVNTKPQAPAAGSAAAVQQQGRIQARRAVLATGDLYSVAISQTSVITSPDITVKAGRGGTATVSGLLDASAKKPGSIGGKIKLLGGTVNLREATVDASGPAGGGEVLIGGDLHGAGSVPTATITTIDQASTIHADATVNGNGGKVVVWSDQTTLFDGKITARGTGLGLGGFAEVSGKQNLAFRGLVDLTAPSGHAGTLLLDPNVLNINNAVTDDAELDDFSIGAADGGAVPFTISAAHLVTQLGLADISLAATSSVNFLVPVDASGNAAAHGLSVTAPTISFSNNANVSLKDGLLSLNGTVALPTGGTLALNTGSGGFFFSGAIDGSASLTLNTSGQTIFSEAIGGNTPLASLTTGLGATALNGAAVTTAGVQTYRGALTLGANTVLTSSGGGGIAFQATVDSATATPRDLTVVTNGATDFEGRVGNTNPLRALDVQGNTLATNGTTILNAPSITTSGAQTYENSTVTASLAAASAGITLTGTTVQFGGTGATVTLSPGGDTYTTTGGVANSSEALGLIKVDGNLVLGRNLELKIQVDGDNLDANGDSFITDRITTTGTVTFGVALNRPALSGTIIGDVPLANQSLTLIDAPGTTVLTGGFSNGAKITMTDADGFNRVFSIDLNSPVTGDLTLSRDLEVYYWDRGAGNDNWSSAANWNLGPIPGGADKRPSNGDAVIFGDPAFYVPASGTTLAMIDDLSNSLRNNLKLSSITFVSGNFSITGSTAAKTITLTDPIGIINTAGNNSLNLPIILGSDSTFQISSGSLTFQASGSINSDNQNTPRNLSVTGNGAITFGGQIGLGTNGVINSNVTTGVLGGDDRPLGSLSVTNTGAIQFGGGPSVGVLTTHRGTLTDGGQSFAGPVVLASDVTFGVLDGDLTGKGNVTFASTVNSDGLPTARNLTVNSSGVTTFGGALGNLALLGNVTTNANGTTAINGMAVTTTGNQSYGDAVKLGANTVLTGTDLSFGSTVDGPFTLTVTGSGTTTFSGVVGGTVEGANTLTGLLSNGAGSTLISGAAVTTTGNQSYNNPVTLGANTALTGNQLILTNGLNGQNHNLTLTFAGAVTVPSALTNLHDFASNGSGGTTIGGNFTTAGNQTYGNAVTLEANATLTGVDIAFGSTLNGPFALVVTGSGTTTFDGAVGALNALTSLDVNGAGATAINGSAVTTSGIQSYSHAVTLGASTTLTGSAITFGGLVDYDPGVGTPINLTVNGPAAINGASVTTSGFQTYGGAVTLGATTVLKGSKITFGGVVDYDLGVGTPISLTVNGPAVINGTSVTTSGFQTYQNAVTLGTTTALTGSKVTFDGLVNYDLTAGPPIALTVNGPVAINGTSVTTSGLQNYNGAVTLGATTILGGSKITFGGVVDYDLGAGTPIDLTVNGPTAINGTSVNTSGFQTYSNAVTLGATTLLTGSKITFDGLVDYDLSVGTPIDLTIDGPTMINGTKVTTSGFQTYSDTVTLGATTTLTGSTITFDNLVNCGPSSPAATGLTVNGNTIFSAAPTLILNADGTATITTASVSTKGAQIYNGSVVLEKDAALKSDTGKIVFGSTVDADSSAPITLVVQTPNTTEFDGDVGSQFPLNKLIVGRNLAGDPFAPNEETIIKGNINTGGFLGKQTTGTTQEFSSVLFLNPVELRADVQIGQWFAANTDPFRFPSGTVKFRDNVTGAFDLTIYTQGDVAIAGGLGKAVTANRLKSVTVEQPQWNAINKPLILVGESVTGGGRRTLTTSGAQIYDGILSVGSKITLTSGNLVKIRDGITGAVMPDGRANNGGSLTIKAPLKATATSATGYINISGPVAGLSTTAGVSGTERQVVDGTAGLNSLSLTAGEDINVSDVKVSGPLSMQAYGHLVLNGSKYVGNGISFNPVKRSPFTFDSTIVKPSGDLNISAGAYFKTGQNQTFIVNTGSLTITAQELTVGDVAAGKNITIRGARKITLLTRPATGRANGIGGIDKGVALLAGGTISLPSGVVPVRSNAALPANIVPNAGSTQFSQNVIVESGDGAIQPLNGGAIPEADTALAPVLPPLSPTDAAAILNLPPEISAPESDDSWDAGQLGGLPPGLKDKLAQLGIYARLVTPEEAKELGSRGETIYRQPVEGKPTMENFEYEVVVNRVTLQEVLRIAAIYDDLVGEKVEQLDAVTALLNRAAQKYAYTGGGAMAFGNWLDTAAGGDTDAGTGLEVLQRLKRIYVEVEALGLTPKEMQISKDAIAAKFAPTGIAPADFENLIKSMKPASLKGRQLEIAANGTPMPEPPPGTVPAPGLQMQMPTFDPNVGQPPLPAAPLPSDAIPTTPLPDSRDATTPEVPQSSTPTPPNGANSEPAAQKETPAKAPPAASPEADSTPSVSPDSSPSGKGTPEAPKSPEPSTPPGPGGSDSSKPAAAQGGPQTPISHFRRPTI